MSQFFQTWSYGPLPATLSGQGWRWHRDLDSSSLSGFFVHSSFLAL